MNKENASKLWKIIQEAGDYLKGQLPDHPNHPKGRNPYAHVAICVKSKFQKSYKDIEDEKFQEVIDYIEFLNEARQTGGTVGHAGSSMDAGWAVHAVHLTTHSPFSASLVSYAAICMHAHARAAAAALQFMPSQAPRSMCAHFYLLGRGLPG